MNTPNIFSHLNLPFWNHKTLIRSEQSTTEMASSSGGGDEKGCVVVELPLVDPTFDLEKAVCSFGLFMMAPNRWDPATKTLQRPLRLPSAASTTVRIMHPSPCGPLHVTILGPTSLSSDEHQAIIAQVRRMLRMSEENERAIQDFHKHHPSFKERGFGRLFRSPTIFEDMVKCILLCNCQWPRTLSMARALCELQLELKCGSMAEDFHPKTPQKKELKRKRGKRTSAVRKLETKFTETEAEASKVAVSNDNPGDSYDSKGNCQIHIPCPPDQIGDFPTPEELATLDASFLARRCKLGYRAQRIVLLAQSIVEGKLQLRKLEQVSDGFITPSCYNELDERLSGIYGFGPFTRANVLVCMGFYHRVPADTETVRHLIQFHGRSLCSLRSVQKEIEAIYDKYAPYQFLAYWSELWGCYEKRFGKLSEMPSCDYQLITASNMKNGGPDELIAINAI